MISMKREKQNSESNEVAMDEKPDYPYGLTLHLDSESLDKLGIKELPEVGAEMMIGAKVKVESINMSDSDDGKEKHVALQVTDMELSGADKPSAADTLYGDMNERG
jgi:hypothetical protein